MLTKIKEKNAAVSMIVVIIIIVIFTAVTIGVSKNLQGGYNGGVTEVADSLGSGVFK